MCPAGSRDEAGLPAGLAHFVEHMVFKGTERRSARELSFEIENAGGQINACTSEDQTVYEGRGEAEMLPILADVLADMVWHATFPESEIQPRTRSHRRGNHHVPRVARRPHRRPHFQRAVGRSSARKPDLRIAGVHRAASTANALLDFRDLHHFRNDLVIAAAGPFTVDEVMNIIAPPPAAGFHPREPKPLPIRPGNGRRPHASPTAARPTNSSFRSPGTRPAATRNHATRCAC